MLGKRTRDHAIVRREALREQVIVKPEKSTDEHALLKQYFEAHFKPLPVTQLPAPQESHDIEEETQSEFSEESEWSGITGVEDSKPIVEVVEHTTSAQASTENRVDIDIKTFMVPSPGNTRLKPITKSPFQSSQPPPSSTPTHKPLPGRPDNASDTTDALNLKHDLALQRLLSESHLLRTPSLSDRAQILDHRLTSIGATAPAQKMPLSHRRGMHAKATAREQMRRDEARESGVVLERATKGKVGAVEKRKRRERAVGGPGVGRFRGGMLALSRRDVRAIEGPPHRVGTNLKGGRMKKKGKR